MVARAPFTCPLAEELAEEVLERLVRYARVDTQAAHRVARRPSTEKQLELSRLLLAELEALGLEDVELTDYHAVLARLPGTAEGPTLGLVAHVDTTPDVPGGGVTPIVHRAWDGSAIRLPGDERQVLDPAELPELAARVGHDLVTSDGTTLLGADDKAGVAEIMTALAYLVRHPERPRPQIRVAFTVDEEVGRGAEGFDLEAFGAEVAYTLDGSGLGELEVETFSAASVRVTIRGLSVHPGTAKGKLVNAVKLAAELIEWLPRERLSPETTEGREGYVHPHRISGNAEEVAVDFIVRDHDDALLEEHVQFLLELADRLARHEPRARIETDVRHSYRNMRATIAEHPRVVEAALEAIRRAGVEPKLAITRGGTDGAVLSALGLPTPNLFTGGHEYHSVREWASLQDMAAAAATVVELAAVWTECPSAGEQG
ncbi:MAG: peptidase T [Gaiellaceae bacterium]|nr:MAG: peptidase T [Gaiellaceae bacterium]